MSFNKEEYWKNRKEGKRGQGELPPFPSLTEEEIDKSHKEGSHIGNVGGVIARINRKQHRQRFINRHFTNGKKLEKTKEVAEAIRERVLRKEAGEKERINKKNDKALENAVRR